MLDRLLRKATNKATVSVGPKLLKIEVEVQEPTALRFVGFDKKKPNTIYFDRQFGWDVEKDIAVFKGKKVFEFPLPIMPNELFVTVRNAKNNSSKGIKIKTFSFSPMPKFDLSYLSEQDRSYVNFVIGIADDLNDLSPGTYKSKDGLFVIHLFDQIRAYEDIPSVGIKKGQVMPTSARINVQTGEIEVAKKEFLKMTVPNRILILLHEYYHYKHQTDSETECDLWATKICRDLGFSETECLYALSKLFLHNDEKNFHPMQRKEQEQRVQTSANFILNYKPNRSKKVN